MQPQILYEGWGGDLFETAVVEDALAHQVEGHVVTELPLLPEAGEWPLDQAVVILDEQPSQSEGFPVELEAFLAPLEQWMLEPQPALVPDLFPGQQDPNLVILEIPFLEHAPFCPLGPFPTVIDRGISFFLLTDNNDSDYLMTDNGISFFVDEDTEKDEF